MPLGKVEVYLGGWNPDLDGAFAECAWIGVGLEADLEVELEATPQS